MNPVAELIAKAEKLIPKETTIKVEAQAMPYQINACAVVATKRKKTIKKVSESFRSRGKIGHRAVPKTPRAKKTQGIILKPAVGPPESR